MPLFFLIGGAAFLSTAAPTVVVPASPLVATRAAAWLPGREADARVAAIAFHLATAGLARCPRPGATAAVVIEHLSQFNLADRSRVAAEQALDRGPEIVALVDGGPAQAAGMRPGDVVLAVAGVELPADEDAAKPFDATRARARSDSLGELLAGAAGRPQTITLLRGGHQVEVRLVSRPACPSIVHLARSAQLNAYADGRHVFLTTGLLARLDGDDQLAFVIAHEMAHNILGHAALMHASHDDGAVRQAERDADRLGGELMLDAGYDPVAGAAALRRLGGLDLGIRLFALHDGAAARIEAMRALVAARGTR